MTLLAIEGLSVSRTGSRNDIIDGITLSVGAGQVVGLVGESGAGKTTLGLAALGFFRDGTEVRDGDVRFQGASLLTPSTSSELRGRRISLVPQHPASALNPALRVRKLVSAMLAAHDVPPADRPTDDPIREVLRAVSLPDTSEFLRRYPHQLSGGQMRRLAIAIALVSGPDVVVLDEPTSGLDAVTSSRVLDTIRGLSNDRDLGVLCISHDLAVVADVADRIAVLYAGHVVEDGPTAAVLADPAHPYTRHLLAAIPRVDGRRAIGLPGRAPPPADRATGCRFATRCDLAHDECRGVVPRLVVVGPDRRSRCIDPFTMPYRLRDRSHSPTRRRQRDEVVLALHDMSASHGDVEVVQSVSLDVVRGEWLAIVGESGAGKTTLIRTIVGTHSGRSGAIELGGTPLTKSVRSRTPSQRQAIQLIPQHPYESFNPRRVVGASVARPLLIGGTSRADTRRAVDEVLTVVSLGIDVADRYPDELSGGELQRAAIARAIIGRPKLLLCDEITASLDSVVQAAIVELLGRLRGELDFTIVFVGHDLGLVQAFSDRTAVMAHGRLLEIGPTAEVFGAPAHAHTQALLRGAARAARLT